MTPGQQGVLSRAAAKRFGWERVDGTTHKCRAVWAHPSGWEVRHCGHPTALWPWSAMAPKVADEVDFVVDQNGRGFQNLARAFEQIDRYERGELTIRVEVCARYGRVGVLEVRS